MCGSITCSTATRLNSTKWGFQPRSPTVSRHYTYSTSKRVSCSGMVRCCELRLLAGWARQPPVTTMPTSIRCDVGHTVPTAHTATSAHDNKQSTQVLKQAGSYDLPVTFSVCKLLLCVRTHNTNNTMPQPTRQCDGCIHPHVCLSPEHNTRVMCGGHAQTHAKGQALCHTHIQSSTSRTTHVSLLEHYLVCPSTHQAPCVTQSCIRVRHTHTHSPDQATHNHAHTHTYTLFDVEHTTHQQQEEQ